MKNLLLFYLFNAIHSSLWSLQDPWNLCGLGKEAIPLHFNVIAQLWSFKYSNHPSMPPSRDLSGNNLPCSFKVLLITIRFESLSIEHKELLKFTIFFFLKQMFSTACICMPLHTVNFHITFGFLTKWSVLWIPFFPSIFIPGRVNDAICCDMAVLCPCVCYVLTYLELQLFTFNFPIVLCLMKYVFLYSWNISETLEN